MLGLLALTGGVHSLWECGCAAGTILRATETRPEEEIEEALLDRVRGVYRQEAESARKKQRCHE